MQSTQIGNATLFLGDAFDILPTLPLVDAIISDPPYGPQTHTGALTLKAGTFSALVDFDSMSEEKFVGFCCHAVKLAKALGGALLRMALRRRVGKGWSAVGALRPMAE